MDKFKNKITNYKFLSSLSLVALSLFTTKFTSTAMIRNPGTLTPKPTSTTTNPTSPTTTFFYGSGGRKIPIYKPTISTTSSISTSPTPSTAQFFYGNGGKRTPVYNTTTTNPKLSSTQNKMDSKPKTQSNPKIDPHAFLAQLRKEVKNTLDIYTQTGNQDKSNLEKTKESILSAIKESTTTSASNLKSTDLKNDIQESIKKHSSIATQTKLNLEKAKQEILESIKKSGK